MPVPNLQLEEPQRDPIEAAKAANLRYVSDNDPGIQRQRQGDDFVYLDTKGQRITDESELERIRAIGIPPAWTDVWICPNPKGHILATGRDEKGRKQYRYHPRWAEIRSETKFTHMYRFGQVLPAIRQRLEDDFNLPGVPREKVLAIIIRLLEETMIRIGNKEYAAANNSFGLTTLRDKHVEVSGTQITFEFRGKSGKDHTIDLKDRRLARLVKRCQDIPGYQLFQYVDEDGTRHPVESGDVNDYLREISGENLSAKDFRTWGGTRTMVEVLREIGPAESETQAKKNISEACKRVAERLGNTTNICRKYYIHPLIVDSYTDGTLFDFLAQQRPPSDDNGLDENEQVIMEMLEKQIAELQET
jgi:DNA topoisomerase I